MKEVKLCLAGFGAVAKRFCQLLKEKEETLFSDFQVKVKISGVCSPSRGVMIDTNGLDIERLFQMENEFRRFDSAHPAYRNCDALGMIAASGADIFAELSTLSIMDGEPAASYITAALTNGLHVISANKGPLAFQYRKLRDEAAKAKKMFRYETIVMDGTPVFNLVEKTLPGNQINGIKGILNSTTNFVLKQLEMGQSYDEAILEAQRNQMAEADPSMDVDGWDGAAKICALANILMDANMTPKDVDRTSIRQVSIDEIKSAQQAGFKIKYICEAQRDENGAVKLSVKPRQLPQNHTFCTVDGSSSVITLYTDLAGEISIIQTDPGILQTAYGVYSDLLSMIRDL
jgi:homoserine dehydrogenase